ncbi:response regulator [Haliangium sp.]|uniref:response regulator n=1 Tax=Haliangium sp. TaxID=2663208 RepID=UPI003D0A0757
MLKVAIFDDVVAMRGETFHIPGLSVDVYGHADDVAALCAQHGYEVVFMDFSMGAERKRGDEAIAALRASGFQGRVIGISSDPAANFEMRRAGADDALAKKAHLRSFLVRLSTDPTARAAGLPDPDAAAAPDAHGGS